MSLFLKKLKAVNAMRIFFPVLEPMSPLCMAGMPPSVKSRKRHFSTGINVSFALSANTNAELNSNTAQRNIDGIYRMPILSAALTSIKRMT